MARPSERRLEEFDPSRNFVSARKDLTLNGKKLERDDPFDKTQVTTRRLKQLYEQGWITYAIEEVRGHASYLSSLSDDQLRDWLSLRGKIPRRGVSRDKLLAQAEAVLAADQKAA